ncbi:MAG: GNAT family N-acetyltransferase [Opitutae bacterium]|nr:GNAT family N-acetyltransferase [Opitutae bacterium]
MIVAGKLVLRRLEHRDLPLRVAWLNDSRINSSLNIKLPVTLAGTEEWFGRIRHNENRADFAFESGGIVVAMGGLTTIDREVEKAELYIFVDPDKENEGIGTNAVKLMCKHGFEELGLGKIYLHVNSDNIAARKVYEKCSFRMEGLMRREIINNGKLKDRCVYAGIRGTVMAFCYIPPPNK